MLAVIIVAWILYIPTDVRGQVFDAHLEWDYSVYGEGIGRGSVLVADFDGDGTEDIVTHGISCGHFWYMIREISPDNFQKVYTSGHYDYISDMALGDVNSDGIEDIFVAEYFLGTVYIYDGPTLEEIARFNVGDWIYDIEVGDIDIDGELELVSLGPSYFKVFSLTSLQEEWRSDFIPGASHTIKVGSVDSDVSLEIVVESTDGGYVFDGVTRQQEWEYADGFGRRFTLSDVNQDGKDDIVFGDGGSICAYDVEQQSVLWEMVTNESINAIEACDIDGDGIPEIITGDYHRGGTYCYDIQSLSELWHIPNRDFGVNSLATGNVNQDAAIEVVWGTDCSTAGDHVLVGNTFTGQLIWRSSSITGPLSSVDIGDVDGDGFSEIVMCSFGSNDVSTDEDGIIHIFDTYSTRSLMNSSGPMIQLLTFKGV